MFSKTVVTFVLGLFKEPSFCTSWLWDTEKRHVATPENRQDVDPSDRISGEICSSRPGYGKGTGNLMHEADRETIGSLPTLCWNIPSGSIKMWIGLFTRFWAFFCECNWYVLICTLFFCDFEGCIRECNRIDQGMQNNYWPGEYEW